MIRARFSPGMCFAAGQRVSIPHLVSLAVWLFVTFLAVVPNLAAASDETEHAAVAEPELHHDHVVVGVKGVSTMEQTYTAGESLSLSGFGIAGVAEKSLFHDRLSLELDLVFTTPGDERSLATEPLAKVPWHLRSWLEPYAAAGPMLVSIRNDEGAHYWLGGGQLVFGALVWFAEMAGLDLDLALGMARGPGMSMIEATFALGPVLRN